LTRFTVALAVLAVLYVLAPIVSDLFFSLLRSLAGAFMCC